MAMEGVPDPGDEAVSLLNQAKLATDGKEKVALLTQLLELVLHRHEDLLPEYLPHLLELQPDPSTDVRKWLAMNLEQLGRKRNAHLVVIFPVLVGLLQDEAPSVTKQTVQCGTALLPAALLYLITGDDKTMSETLQEFPAGSAELAGASDLWLQITLFKDTVSSFITKHNNDGVRLHCVKFIETAVLLYSPDSPPKGKPPPGAAVKDVNSSWISDNHPILNMGQLVQEASRHVTELLSQLKLPASEHLPGPVALLLITSLASTARNRPMFLGRIAPTLLSLASSAKKLEDGSAEVYLGKAQPASVVHHLKRAYVDLIKCGLPQAAPWKDRLVTALKDLHESDAAESALRFLTRQHQRLNPSQSTSSQSQPIRTAKRPQPEENGIEPKRQKSVESSDPRSLDPRNPDPRNLEPRSLGPRNLDPSSLDPRTLDPRTLDPRNLDPRVPGQPPRSLDSRNADPSGLDPRVQDPRVQDPRVQDPRVQDPRGQDPRGHLDPRVSEARNLHPRDLDRRNSNPRSLEPPPEVKGGSPLEQLIGLIANLAAQGAGAKEPLRKLIDSLPGHTLADIVIMNMQHLPAQSPDGSVGTPGGALAALMGGLAAARSAQSKPPPQAPPQAPPRQASTARDPRRDPRLKQPLKTQPPETSPPSSSRDPRQQLRAKVKIEQTEFPLQEIPETSRDSGPVGTSRDSGAPRHREQELKPFRGPMIPLNSAGQMILSVVELSEEEKLKMRSAAIKRIVEGVKGGAEWSGRILRLGVLARLINEADSKELLLEHIFSDYHAHQGHELSLHWLYHLYVNSIRSERPEEVQNSESNMIVPYGEAKGSKNYEELLLTLVRGVRDKLPCNDISLRKLLVEAPLLPPGALQLVEEMLDLSFSPHVQAKEKEEKDDIDEEIGDKKPSEPKGKGRVDCVTQALGVLWQLIVQRPTVRKIALNACLKCATDNQEEIRGKAIRLVANKLFALEYLQDAIEAFAIEMLNKVVDPEAETDTKKRQLERSDSTASKKQRGEEGALEVPASQPSESDTAKIIEKRTGPSLAEAKQSISLFLALCAKKPTLLPKLLTAYGTAPVSTKEVIQQNIAPLVRGIGSSSPPLLDIISDLPPGCTPLLLQMIHTLTSSGAPSPELISRVRLLYDTKVKDARFLVPIVSFLQKDQVRVLLPQLLELDTQQFKVALQRILQGSAVSGPALTPAEVLIALHQIDPQKHNVPLKKVFDACSVCFAMKTVFTPQVLATALNQLVEQSPLPLIFMRTVILSTNAAPSLMGFVMELLSRLVRKEIWKMPKLWEGFVKCCQQAAPNSFPVLLQLPTQQLEAVLKQLPDFKARLAAHAAQSNVRTNTPRSTLALLGVTPSGAPEATEEPVAPM